MGTRLYPRTDNPDTLEKLCNVEMGSYQRLRMLEEMTADYKTKHSDRSENDQEFRYELWKICEGNEDLNRLSGFILNGWGRIERCFLPEEVNAVFKGPCGATDERYESLRLIHASDMGAIWRTVNKYPYADDEDQVERLWELCEGVCWH